MACSNSKHLSGAEVHRLPAGAVPAELLHRPCATGTILYKSGNRMCNLLDMLGLDNGLAVLYRLKEFGQSCLGYCGPILAHAALFQSIVVTILLRDADIGHSRRAGAGMPSVCHSYLQL